MIDEVRDSELIDTFLSGGASAEQKSEVERRLKDDPEFLVLFSELDKIIDGIRFEAREKLKSDILKLEHDLTAAESSQSYSFFYWSAGIAALLLLSFGIFWQVKKSHTAKPSLFSEVFVPYPNIIKPTVRGGSLLQDTLGMAYTAYDRGEFKEAIVFFRKIAKPDAAIKLYTGNSLLVLGKAREAQDEFKTVIKDFDDFDEQAEWYLSLAYLREGNKEETSRILKTIVARRNSYSIKAADLLAKIHSSE